MLTQAELDTMEAVIGLILPSGDGPGAREAHVMGYVRWLLSQSFFEPRAPQLRKKIAILNRLAQSRHQRPFVICSPAERGGVFSEMAQSASPLGQSSAEMFVQMSLAGFLCDPKYGGNKNKTGWRYIGAPEERHAADSES